MSRPRDGAAAPVLVTGATSGIGLELSRQLVERGFRVFGGALPGEDSTALDETGSTLVPLDVTDSDSLAEARAVVEGHLGREPLWGLVNNAGVVDAGPVEMMDLRETRRVFDVNVLGVLAVTQTFLPSIRAAKGRIVNMSSLSGCLAVPFLGAYCASKAAIESLSDSLRRELHPFDVDVIIVQPGVTHTPLWSRAEEIDRGRFQGSGYEDALETVQRQAVGKGRRGMPPWKVAQAILKVLEAERAPTRLRIQRKRSSRLRYSLLPLVSDRVVDRMVAKRVWGERSAGDGAGE